MKEKLINSVYIEGVLYNHNLELKVTGNTSKQPGTEYIRGNVEVATDNAMINIIPINYVYVTKLTKNGTENRLFKVLKDIIDGNLKTYLQDGAAATKVRVNSKLGLNEYYSTTRKDEKGEPALTSYLINQNGFISVLTKALKEKEADRAKFEVDFFINKVREIDEDPDTGKERKVILSGYIFDDFRKNIMPVNFSVYDAGGIDYFLSQEIGQGNPMFTKVVGKEVSINVIKKVTLESAFGEEVRETPFTNRDFVVTWAPPEPYEIGVDITAGELKTKAQEREVYLAELKNRALMAASTPKPSIGIAKDDFDF